MRHLKASIVVNLAAAMCVATAQEATLSKDGSELQLAGARAKLDATYNTLAWATTGRRILLHHAPGGSLGIYRVEAGALMSLSASAVNPSWSPDGKMLSYGVPTGGIRVYNATTPNEPSELIASDALPGSGAWAPDSARLSYATPDGVWVASRLSNAKREVAKIKGVQCTTWSPDGRTLLIGTKERLVKLTVADQVLQELGKVGADSMTYSPSGKLVLIRVVDGFKVVDAAAKQVVALPRDARQPVWLGGRKLAYVSDSAVYSLSCEKGAIPTRVRPVPEGSSWAAVPSIEITNDVLIADPFRRAKRPLRGQLRLKGVIDDADVIDGTCSVLVSSYVDWHGNEAYLPSPREQKITVPVSAVQADGRGQRQFRLMDLQPDSEVSIVVNASALSAGYLDAAEIWIAGENFTKEAPVKVTAPSPAHKGHSHSPAGPIDYDGVSHEKVMIPLVFPVAGKCNWSDTFLASRAGGRRRHHGQDIMADKMTPLVACFNGVVRVGRARKVGGHNTLTIYGDNGWIANYYHVNNDTPGTNDGRGTDLYAFAPGLSSGQRVKAGQFIGYVGNSGNAETTPPHLHFEIWHSGRRAVINAAPSLRNAVKVRVDQHGNR